jgi:hypothetical protein
MDQRGTSAIDPHRKLTRYFYVHGMDSANEGRRAFLRAAAGFAVAPTLAGCVYFSSGVTYRYRMTVHVDTAAGPRSGSSVREVTHYPNGTYPTRLQGEAVAVDLPGGQTLFAMLGRRRNESAATLAYAAYDPPVLYGPDAWRDQAEFIKRQTRPATLKAEDLPTFIRYRDPADARTVELVDPFYLSTSFGPGVRLNRVVIQITEDPVTSTIESRLPNFSRSDYGAWLGTLRYNDPRRLATQDFRTGF